MVLTQVRRTRGQIWPVPQSPDFGYFLQATEAGGRATTLTGPVSHYEKVLKPRGILVLLGPDVYPGCTRDKLEWRYG